jgi:hypothetical protein
VSAGQLGEERDPGSLDTPAQHRGPFDIDFDRGGTVDGFPRLAGSENWQFAIPLGGEDAESVNVFPAGEFAEPVDRGGVDFPGGGFRPVGHWITDGPHFETVTERAECRRMPGIPSIAETDDTKAELHLNSGTGTAFL